MFAPTTSVSLLKVCIKSRKHVLTYYSLYSESQSSTPNNIKGNADIVEDPKRGWERERYIETLRFLMRRKEVEADSRINFQLDVVLLDPEQLSILYIAEKWLPGAFKHKLKYLALTVKQCFLTSAGPTYWLG